MDYMSRKTKIQKKKRLQHILKGDYETLDINENYMIATFDYDLEQLNGSIKEANERPPLWDWFTLVNKKKNKIWYLDFSAPYVWHEFFDQDIDSQKKYITNFWSIKDIPFTIKSTPIKGGMYKLEEDDPNYDLKLEQRIQFYLENNDWDKTFNDFKIKNQINQNWNEGIQIYRGENKDSWGIVVPHLYTDESFLEVFTEAVDLFNQNKFNQNSYNLIQEIDFNLFIK
jgi:hypothetical protein